jgi:hypothetical protein
MQRAVANVVDDLKPNASIPAGILISKVLYRMFLKCLEKIYTMIEPLGIPFFLKTQIYTQIYFHHISCNVIVYGWDSERTTASYEKD